MATDPGPYLLESTRLILAPDGKATPKDVTPNFYAELDTEFDGFKGHILVSKHEFTAAWESWEVHPESDELVYLISGDIDFVLWRDGAEVVLRVDQPGSCVVVPKGIWHTARPHETTAMLFMTPGEGTLNAAEPEGEPF